MRIAFETLSAIVQWINRNIDRVIQSQVLIGFRPRSDDMSRPEKPNPQQPVLDQLQAGTAPQGLKLPGRWNLGSRALPGPLHLPDNITADALELSEREELLELPSGLTAYELLLRNTGLRRLPEDLRVQLRIDLTGCEYLEMLPAGLQVTTLNLQRCTNLVALPEGLDVWSLDMTGCWAFQHWPSRLSIRSGRLILRGCTALRELPPDLSRLSALNVRECPNLTRLPEGLVVTGWIDIAHSGLTTEECLPAGLERVQLRWGGVNIDRRIAFHPESLTVDEVLEEQNAEKRRVLLDRYGYARLLVDAQAEIRDTDRDPGGERQLFRLPLPGDEDLVAMSCHCPSTGRQYIIRVPPTTPTCRHAAAWIAGFDNPDDYQPLIET